MNRLLQSKEEHTGFDESLWQFGLSLRRVGATTMAASRVPDRVVRAMGRWNPGAYHLYSDLQVHEKEMWAEVVNCLVQNKEEGDQVSVERLSEIIDGSRLEVEVDEYMYESLCGQVTVDLQSSKGASTRQVECPSVTQGEQCLSERGIRSVSKRSVNQVSEQSRSMSNRSTSQTSACGWLEMLHNVKQNTSRPLNTPQHKTCHYHSG